MMFFKVLCQLKQRAALEGSADAKLAGNITTVADYAAFRTWALALSDFTPKEVKNSAYSWLSYALNAETLIAAAPKEVDVTIDTFESAATDGAFDFTVKIDGIDVGEDALEANIRKEISVRQVQSSGIPYSSHELTNQIRCIYFRTPPNIPKLRFDINLSFMVRYKSVGERTLSNLMDSSDEKKRIFEFGCGNSHVAALFKSGGIACHEDGFYH